MRSLLFAGLLTFAVACGAARAPVQRPIADTSLCRTTIPADEPASPLAWSGPAEPDDRRPLDAWCAAVGPSVVIGAPADGHRPARPDAVAFVTWNVHVGGGDVPAFVAALRRGELTGGEPVEHVVLLLQEVFREGPDVPAHVSHPDAAAGRISAAPPDGTRRDVVDLARTLGFALAYVPSMRNGGAADGPAEDRGNAILSSLPLSDLRAIELPFDRQRRVAVAATVSGVAPDGTPWHVRVASSHLNATAGAGRLWLFASGLRAAQARSLAAALDGIEPAVLGSDLNTWADGPREPAVRELRRAFADTAAPDPAPTFHLGFRLDYLFFRLPDGWSGASMRISDRFGSDHHPLLGRLRIS